MSRKRIEELCDAVENGSARAEDVKELASLARTAAKEVDEVINALRKYAPMLRGKTRSLLERAFLKHLP